jgi:hypothetical protein
MMEILKFVFSNFWYFLGTLMLTTAILNGIAEIIRAFHPKNKRDKYQFGKDEKNF